MIDFAFHKPDRLLSVREVFGIDSDLMAAAFSEPDEHVPERDAVYRFNPEVTLAILAGFMRDRRVLVQGLHGTGKSTHTEQVAARLNWPCVRVNLDGHISRLDLVGKDAVVLRDGQQVMLQAREVKNIDELTLLNMASAMVDGVYQDIAEALKPGVKESEIVALATARLYEMGSDCVEAINSISGERCSPHPHNFTDRLIRPGDQAFFDVIQSYMGYRTCYYRTFSVGRATAPQRTAYRKAREWMDRAIEKLRPGISSDRIAAVLPKASDIGFSSEMEAFGLNFCHGLGLGLHERPLISRLNSFKEPIELKAGMVFAVETYCPASDGFSAARIEEEVILTPKGPQIISLYPAEELPIANPY